MFRLFKNKLHVNKVSKSAKGFTLIELLLVVVLISILSGLILSVINVSGMRNRSKDAQRAGDLKRIQTALELYFTDHRGYPANAGGFSTVSSILTTPLVGTYVQVLPADPRAGDAMTASCSQSTYNYFYKTDAAAASGLASRYVLMTFMEYPNSVGNNACSSLANCSSATISNCNCASPCYGVENPL